MNIIVTFIYKLWRILVVDMPTPEFAENDAILLMLGSQRCVYIRVSIGYPTRALLIGLYNTTSTHT